jgi:hypothetical protein
MNRLAQLLESAEQIVSASNDVDLLNLNDLEPTPIGPNGIQNIVNEFPLFSSSFNLNYDDMTPIPIKNFQQEQQLPSQSLCWSPDWTFSVSDINDDIDRVVSTTTTTALSNSPILQMPVVSSSSSLSSSTSSTSSNNKTKQRRARKFQTGQWNVRYNELLQFREQHGHLFVPHSYEPNQKLAQWVKVSTEMTLLYVCTSLTLLKHDLTRNILVPTLPTFLYRDNDISTN